MYEPELFPGVIYQTARKGLVAHVFLSGRVSYSLCLLQLHQGKISYCLLSQTKLNFDLSVKK